MYCAELGPHGFYCVLAAKHEGPHLSIRNDRLWKGTPGAPVCWTTRDETTELALDPLRATCEVGKADPTELDYIRQAYTGEMCSCGSPYVIRTGTCRHALHAERPRLVADR